jgi:hypothetical protein
MVMVFSILDQAYPYSRVDIIVYWVAEFRSTWLYMSMSPPPHPRVTKTSNVKQPKLKDNHASVQQEPEDDEFQTMLPEKGPF